VVLAAAGVNSVPAAKVVTVGLTLPRVGIPRGRTEVGVESVTGDATPIRQEPGDAQIAQLFSCEDERALAMAYQRWAGLVHGIATRALGSSQDVWSADTWRHGRTAWDPSPRSETSSIT
jgi:hypothetical protein